MLDSSMGLNVQRTKLTRTFDTPLLCRTDEVQLGNLVSVRRLGNTTACKDREKPINFRCTAELSD